MSLKHPDRRIQSTFELVRDFAVPPAKVYEYLSEPRNHLGLQVLLTSLSEVVVRQDETGHTVKNYETVETFRWLGIPLYHNRIRVAMTLEEPGRTLVSRVKSKPNMDIKATYTFDSVGQGTQLKLRFEILVSKWLVSAVTAEAERVQTILMDKLSEKLTF